jgi:hypothetical protein
VRLVLGRKEIAGVDDAQIGGAELRFEPFGGDQRFHHFSSAAAFDNAEPLQRRNIFRNCNAGRQPDRLDRGAKSADSISQPEARSFGARFAPFTAAL